jgi:integrase
MSREQLPPRLAKLSTSPNWYIFWFDDERPRRASCHTTDKAEAEAQLADFLRRRGETTHGVRSPDRITINEALAKYLEKIEDKPGARPAANNAATLLRYWGASTVDAITESSIKAYIAWRTGQRGNRGKPHVADWTVYGELSVLRAAINNLVKAGELTRAPFVKLPTAPPSRDLWLENFEAKLLVESCVEDHLRLFVELGLHTGGRKQAILDLRWTPQIDLARKRIDLNPPGRKQTSKRRSIVPMSDRIYGILQEARGRARGPYVIEYFRYERKPHVDPVIGRRLPQIGQGKVGDIKTGFAAACRRARVVALTNARQADRGTRARLGWFEASIKFKRATPNTLRHTAGTWMAQEGVDLWKIAGWLGHTIERTTELYAHHHPDYLEEGSSALERRMNRESRLQVAINERPTMDSSGFERPDRAVNAED